MARACFFAPKDVIAKKNPSAVTQVLLMGGVCLLFSFLHLISPMRRGSIMTFAVVLFVCLGAPAGYTAARLYKMMGGEFWKASTMATAFLVPGIVFGLFFINNTVSFACQLAQPRRRGACEREHWWAMVAEKSLAVPACDKVVRTEERMHPAAHD